MPRTSPRSTLFPYTTLFRSIIEVLAGERPGHSEAFGKEIKSRMEDVIMVQTNCLGLAVVHHLSAGRTFIKNLSFARSEEHTSELQSPMYLVCRLLLEKKKKG